MTKLYWKDRIIVCSMILLYILMFTMIGKYFVSKAAEKNWGLSNETVNFIMEKSEQNKSREIAIDWEKQYPFAGKSMSTNQEKIRHSSTPVERLNNWIQKNLWGYYKFIELKATYDTKIGWNICLQANLPIKNLGKGYFSFVYPKRDQQEKINSIVDFQKFCSSLNIPFLFVQAPFKISREMERNRSEPENFANVNADDIVNGLREQGIQVLDIREQIEKNGLDNLELFFKTDHHWKPETGLWASGLISNRLCEMMPQEFSYNKRVFAKSNYNIKMFHDNFLGSHGRALTMARVKPENIDLLYPKTSTDFICHVPSRDINQKGDFSILYDMEKVQKKEYYVQEKDYYTRDSYEAYCYGDQPYMQIKNLNSMAVPKKYCLLKILMHV